MLYDKPDRVRGIIEAHRARASSIEARAMPRAHALAANCRSMARELLRGAAEYEGRGELQTLAEGYLARARAKGYTGEDALVSAVMIALREQVEQIARQLLLRGIEFEGAAARLEAERAASLASVELLTDDEDEEKEPSQ